MMLNIALMIGWIVLAASFQEWPVLTIGTVAFAVVLVGLTFYMVLTIKEVRVSQQQANFVDSVTHELKTPIASLRLYLETLQIRNLDDSQRNSFYDVMEGELRRLDQLISHLLEVGRLDELGRETEPEDIDVPTNSVPTIGEFDSRKSSCKSATQLTWISPVKTTGLRIFFS